MRYTFIMFETFDFSFKILAVLKLSWSAQNKYAFPRPYHALSFRVKGAADFIHDDKTYPVQETDVLFVPKNYDYTLQAHQAEEVIVVHFDADFDFSEIKTFTPTDGEQFFALFNEMENVWRGRAVGYKNRIYALFYSILETMEIQAAKSAAAQMDVSEHFETACAYLRANFANPDLTVEKLSSIANVSSVYFRKLFHKVYGTSPLKYLTALRLKRAKSLLKTGYCTVEDVALQCGFNDPKYFSTAYKNFYGHSPAKDRERLFKTV